MKKAKVESEDSDKEEEKDKDSDMSDSIEDSDWLITDNAPFFMFCFVGSYYNNHLQK